MFDQNNLNTFFYLTCAISYGKSDVATRSAPASDWDSETVELVWYTGSIAAGQACNLTFRRYYTQPAVKVLTSKLEMMISTTTPTESKCDATNPCYKSKFAPTDLT